MSTHEARVPVPTTAQHATPEPTAATPTTAAPASPVPVGGLTVGHADDPAEHLADQMADTALERLRRATGSDGGSGAPGTEQDAHRHSPGCDHLRRSTSAAAAPGAVVGAEGGALDASTSGRIEAARGGGAPLPGAVRRRMETAFGSGLGHVRVHTGAEAGSLSAALSAEAFTTGQDIFFGAGAFAPSTAAGERVLAHEIGHVLSEPGAVRRSFFGRIKSGVSSIFSSTPTPDEIAHKNGKKVEKTEENRLAESRTQGMAGRTELTEHVYGGDPASTERDTTAVATDTNAGGVGPLEQTGTSQRLSQLTTDFEKALAYERTRTQELHQSEQALPPAQRRSDAEIAAEAYVDAWYNAYPHLTPVRPARETAAEQLVQQIRQARTSASVDTSAQDDLADALRLGTLLDAKIERLYDKMAVQMATQLEDAPELGDALAQHQARGAVLEGVDVKLRAKVPPQDTPLDVAAWDAARTRLGHRAVKKARDAAALESALLLLPPQERTSARTEKEAEQAERDTAEADGKKVRTKVETGDAVLDVVETGGGVVTTLAGLAGSLAEKIGEKKDEALKKKREEASGTKEEDEDEAFALPMGADLGIGELVHQSKKTNTQVKKKKRSEDESPDLPVSAATKAAAGIGQVTSIFDELLSAARSGLKMAGSIDAAWSDDDPYQALEASKAGADGLTSLVSSAKSCANLAKTIDSGVASGVKRVIPGLDIASAAIAMARSVAEVAQAGMRQRETDRALFEARVRTTSTVNVTVYPLMRVSQAYTKNLENKVWGLGSNVLDFSLSVAQVATAGGFGIPAAIKAAAAVTNKVHELGHFIADQVLASMSMRATTESSVLHLEGAAEQELKRNPGMAVDAIIFKAAQGDPVALDFLGSYRIDGKPITEAFVRQIRPRPVRPFDPANPEAGGDATSDDALLLQIRAVVLDQMETGSDPQTLYSELKQQASDAPGQLREFVDDVATRSSEVGALARERNEMAAAGELGANTKTNRGFFWQARTLLQSGRQDQLTAKTAAFKDVERLPDGVVCAVGTCTLAKNATPPEIASFISLLTTTMIEAEIARRPRRNSPEWIDFLREALKREKSAPADKWEAPTRARSNAVTSR